MGHAAAGTTKANTTAAARPTCITAGSARMANTSLSSGTGMLAPMVAADAGYDLPASSA